MKFKLYLVHLLIFPSSESCCEVASYNLTGFVVNVHMISGKVQQ